MNRKEARDRLRERVKEQEEAAARAARPQPGPEYPCTECGGNAFVGYIAHRFRDWGGLVKIGERLCTRCFQKRGGKGFV